MIPSGPSFTISLGASEAGFTRSQPKIASPLPVGIRLLHQAR